MGEAPTGWIPSAHEKRSGFWETLSAICGQLPTEACAPRKLPKLGGYLLSDPLPSLWLVETTNVKLGFQSRLLTRKETTVWLSLLRHYTTVSYRCYRNQNQIMHIDHLWPFHSIKWAFCWFCEAISRRFTKKWWWWWRANHFKIRLGYSLLSFLASLESLTLLNCYWFLNLGIMFNRAVRVYDFDLLRNHVWWKRFVLKDFLSNRQVTQESFQLIYYKKTSFSQFHRWLGLL